MRAAAAPGRCQLGGPGCTAPAEIKIADSWGYSAWGCPIRVDEVIINVRSVFIANEELGALAAYLHRWPAARPPPAGTAAGLSRTGRVAFGG